MPPVPITTNNERALDFWAKLFAIAMFLVLGYSAGYYQASVDASRLVQEHTATAP